MPDPASLKSAGVCRLRGGAAKDVAARGFRPSGTWMSRARVLEQDAEPRGGRNPLVAAAPARSRGFCSGLAATAPARSEAFALAAAAPARKALQQPNGCSPSAVARTAAAPPEASAVARNAAAPPEGDEYRRFSTWPDPASLILEKDQKKGPGCPGPSCPSSRTALRTCSARRPARSGRTAPFPVPGRARPGSGSGCRC